LVRDEQVAGWMAELNARLPGGQWHAVTVKRVLSRLG